jgi:CMD domain protein
MPQDPFDVIDHLAGIGPTSSLQGLRLARQVARDQAQDSFRALFEPDGEGAVTAVERLAVATFVAGLHQDAAATAFYAARLTGLHPSLASVVAAETVKAAAEGPFGRYPPGPLSEENVDGPVYVPGREASGALGQRLSAAFSHGHLLLFHPRDAGPADLQALFDAGWDNDGIVTLSQLIAFLSFQIRAAHGLRVLAGQSSR